MRPSNLVEPAAQAARPPSRQGKIQSPAPRPSLPSRLSPHLHLHYFAPSQAVWTTAKERALVPLLPVEQARMYARLAHNYELLADSRESVYRGCNAIASMQQRFAQANAPAAPRSPGP